MLFCFIKGKGIAQIFKVLAHRLMIDCVLVFMQYLCNIARRGDFVAIKRNEKLYIQVSDNISDGDTFAREVAPLLQIKDAYPPDIFSREYHSGEFYKRQRHCTDIQGTCPPSYDDNISDGDTFAREVAPLLQIKDAYPKMVLARTRYEEYQYEGIRVIDIADWLLENP